MTERARIALSMLLGAGLGGLIGYLYLTEDGRRVRGEIEPRLDDFIAEMRRLRGTFEKTRLAAQEAWNALTELAGDAPRSEPWRASRASSSR